MKNASDTNPGFTVDAILSRAAKGAGRKEPYPFWVRFFDFRGGFVDGPRINPARLRASGSEDVELKQSTEWINAREHSLNQQLHHDRVEAERDTHAAQVQYRVVLARLAEAEKHWETARYASESMPAEPTDEFLKVRRAAENLDSPELTRQRRLKEYSAKLTRLQAAAASSREEVRNLTAEAEALRSVLEKVYQLTIQRGMRLKAHYERRAATYRRAFVRRTRDSDDASAPLAYLAVLDAPPWWSAPCPWTLPDADGRAHRQTSACKENEE